MTHNKPVMLLAKTMQHFLYSPLIVLQEKTPRVQRLEVATYFLPLPISCEIFLVEAVSSFEKETRVLRVNEFLRNHKNYRCNCIFIRTKLVNEILPYLNAAVPAKMQLSFKNKIIAVEKVVTDLIFLLTMCASSYAHHHACMCLVSILTQSKPCVQLTAIRHKLIIK
uniref:Uncharacterized protein n=1 Tax=Ciona intestinalis TaxID=7719 RepID=H2XKQ9_CIOIN